MPVTSVEDRLWILAFRQNLSRLLGNRMEDAKPDAKIDRVLLDV